ncbi:MAG: hypothetical protein KJ706_00570 [Candidatus Omnitrophica bacterium]|nr:hypothetical protein [Candidatus Omnitrophota bacterium]
MGKQTRKWHSKFIEYMQKIVRHPTYKGMPEPYKDDGEIRWICTGKSPLGQARERWWNAKRKTLNIKKEPGWKALVARHIHPFGKKPCQICGRELELDYVYPNKTYPGNPEPYKEIRNHSCPAYDATKQCSHLGPGAMSDCPDRLDGFHTYNRCCRSKEDTGRHASNLSRYGEDRRAYEFWADGDWKAASWLMKVFASHGVSADHIGPLSLGFCHRPKFHPMTRHGNSAKGNRLTLSDIADLIADEHKREQVVSWHSRFVWDLLKRKVTTPEQAKRLSSLMRKNMHFVLGALAYIKSTGGRACTNFLVNAFLHPKYALFQYEFVEFDKRTGTYDKMLTTPADRTEHTRNAERYTRKSLESLDEYSEKANRNQELIFDGEELSLLNQAIVSAKRGETVKARHLIEAVLKHRGENLAVMF